MSRRIETRLKRIFSVKTKKAFDKKTNKSVKNLLQIAYLQSKEFYTRKKILSEIGSIIEDDIRYKLCCKAIRKARIHGQILRIKMELDMQLILDQTKTNIKILKYCCQKSLSESVKTILNAQELEDNWCYSMWLIDNVIRIKSEYSYKSFDIIINCTNWWKYGKMWINSRFYMNLNDYMLFYITKCTWHWQLYRCKNRKKILISRFIKLLKWSLLEKDSFTISRFIYNILFKDEEFMFKYLTQLKKNNEPFMSIPPRYRKKWLWYAELDN